MSPTRLSAGVSALFLTLCASTALAQGAPPMPQPGPEHQVLRMDEGTWDAIVEMTMGPGAPPVTSKGVEVNTIGCGGLCVISDFTSEMMGSPFHGHGVTTYDPARKKYVGSWTDSMSAGLALSEGTYDPAAKTATGWMEAPDMTGKVTRSKTTVHYVDADHRVMTMFVAGPDGKEIQVMKISYARRK
jgi:Protein of unknown function (DUF1579)